MTQKLADLKDMTDEELRAHIASSYETDRAALDNWDFIVAYESVGSWGCDSSSWFLLRSKETGQLYETHGSHCSCFGFEGQWDPEPTTVAYLQSEKFYMPGGGYDYSLDENVKAAKEEIAKL